MGFMTFMIKIKPGSSNLNTRLLGIITEFHSFVASLKIRISYLNF